MPDEHARLSPSASKRWIACPASIRMQDAVPHDGGDSPYAREGTIAHELGELEARAAFEGWDVMRLMAARAEWAARNEVDPGTEAEMLEHAEAYVALIDEYRSAEPHTMWFLEKRVQTGIPLCWGTSDTVLVSPTTVTIIDLKYGMGVQVSAWENPQLMLYGVGALENFGELHGDIQTVRMVIFQPRLDHVSVFEMPAADLKAWRDSVLPVAEEALAGSDRFGPSDEVCRWCPAKGTCRARFEWATQQDFSARPDLLTNEELGDVLEHLPGIRSWTKDVEEAALAAAYGRSEAIPGWKVVLSGGTRQITDQDAAIEKFEAAGLARDQVVKPPVVQLLGLGDLEKQLKSLPKIKPEGAARARAQKLEDVLGDLVTKSPGRPSLVPESDPRPNINPEMSAARDFAEPTVEPVI